MYYRINHYPVRELVSMQDSMNRLFSNMFAPTAEDGTLVASPAIDIKSGSTSVRVMQKVHEKRKCVKVISHSNDTGEIELFVK